MYNAKRDGDCEGANLAIPSMGEIEGRITVLEVVAKTCLTLLVHSGDRHAAQQALSAIRGAMRAKCDEIKLCKADADSAIAYAQELFAAAFANTDRDAGSIALPQADLAQTHGSARKEGSVDGR